MTVLLFFGKWIVDSEACAHVCNNLELFRDTKSTDVAVLLANGGLNTVTVYL